MNKQAMNKSSSFKLPALFATLAVLSACGEAPVEEQKKSVIQAVKLSQVVSPNNLSERRFPAEVSAVKTVDVSFEVTGRLKYQNLTTGTKVKKGELLAELDPAPFERSVKEQKARLEQAKRELSRTTSTFNKGLASQSQLDNAKTSFELAEIALANAKQDLAYTKVTAPFNAQISERVVENDSFVRAGDIIARLQDVSRYYFNINVPERLVTGYKRSQLKLAEAELLSQPGKTFPLTYVEHSTQVDPITQTFKVVFAMEASGELSLVPGSRALVHLVSNSDKSINGKVVPITALLGNKDNGFHVWVFNKANSKVNKVNVDVLHLENNMALIDGKLDIDDLIVSAGASKMQPGLEVKAYLPEK
jgi:RND family efflux transporter MFP subunit